MSYYNNRKIIDRQKETSEIVSNITKSSSTDNYILLVYGNSGVGKSSLMEKVSKTDLIRREFVFVNMPPKNNDNLCEKGAFINEIVKTLNNTKGLFDDLSSFIFHGFSERYRKSEMERLIFSSQKFPAKLGSLFIGKSLNLGNADVNKILYSNEEYAMLIKIEYIDFVLKSSNIILDVSNVQNIDRFSAFTLKNLLLNNKGAFWIFEYTTNEKNDCRIEEMLDFYSSVAIVKKYKVGFLPTDYALTTLELKPEELKVADRLKKYYSEQANGNLFKIKFLKDEMLLKLTDNDDIDPISYKINQLRETEKTTLAIICLCDGCLSYNTFTEIIKFLSNSFYITVDVLNKLNDFILINNEGTIQIIHASIIDSLSENKEKFAFLSAYEILKGYYENKIKQLDAKSEEYRKSKLHLLKLDSLFCPEKILEDIEGFKRTLVSCFSEEQAAYILNNIFLSLDNKATKLVIVNIAYSLGFYKTGIDLISKIKLNNYNFELLECALLNRNDFHEETISKCNFIISKEKDKRVILIALMIRMLSERSLGDYIACERTLKQLLKKRKYKKYDEYGFLLRNTQLVYSYSDSIRYIKKSIKFFKKRNKNKETGLSLLTLAVQKARLGDTKFAKELLNSLNHVYEDTTFERHIISLNQIAVTLLDGTSNEQDFFLLKKLLIYATTTFDKITILNNMLCWCIVHKSSSEMFYEVKRQLDDLLFEEPDIRLRKRTYVNYSIYFRDVLKDEETYRKFIKKAASINAKDLLCDYFIYGICKDKNYQYLCKCCCYVSFITYWHFDIPMI